MSEKQYTQLSDLASLPELVTDLSLIAELVDRERRSALDIGKIAHRWIDDHRYHRVLNTRVFTDLLKEQTGRTLTGRQIGNYIDAFKTHSTLDAAGVKCPNLSASHLAQIGAARCDAPEEVIELAQRVNDRKATVKQVRALAQQVHAERR